MKQVNFDYINWEKYQETQTELLSLNMNKDLDLVRAEHLKSEVEKYESNFSLFFNRMGKGNANFAQLAHYEIRDRRRNRHVEEESHIIPAMERVDYEHVVIRPTNGTPGTMWRYQIGDEVETNDGEQLKVLDLHLENSVYLYETVDRYGNKAFTKDVNLV
jgi:hypothetical protein